MNQTLTNAFTDELEKLASAAPWDKNPGAFARFDPDWRELPKNSRPPRKGLFGLGGHGHFGAEDLTLPRLRKILQYRKQRRTDSVDRWLIQNPGQHRKFIRWYRGQ